MFKYIYFLLFCYKKLTILKEINRQFFFIYKRNISKVIILL